jgi:hypothetical protein
MRFAVVEAAGWGDVVWLDPTLLDGLPGRYGPLAPDPDAIPIVRRLPHPGIAAPAQPFDIFVQFPRPRGGLQCYARRLRVPSSRCWRTCAGNFDCRAMGGSSNGGAHRSAPS